MDARQLASYARRVERQSGVVVRQAGAQIVDLHGRDAQRHVIRGGLRGQARRGAGAPAAGWRAQSEVSTEDGPVTGDSEW